MRACLRAYTVCVFENVCVAQVCVCVCLCDMNVNTCAALFRFFTKLVLVAVREVCCCEDESHHSQTLQLWPECEARSRCVTREERWQWLKCGWERRLVYLSFLLLIVFVVAVWQVI